MSDAVRDSLEALLALLDEEREKRCTALRDSAGEAARKLIRDARREARRRMHLAVREERQRSRTELTAAAARLETRGQQYYREGLSHTLQRAWDRLQPALLQCWRQPATRRAWIERLLREALAVLPAQTWEVRHPPDWDAAELDPWRDGIRGHCGDDPRLRPEDGLDAGLRIGAAGVNLDGSIEGLLHDRRRVEGLLLARIEAGGNGGG